MSTGDSAQQGRLFPDPQEGEAREKELCALDELFESSRRYRSSRDYMDRLNFITRFRKYAPFNCLLMHIQNRGVSYVATGREWFRTFERRPKRDARPLMILQPFGPVMFVYDVLDTEGRPLPDNLIKPFDTKGKLPRDVFDCTVHNCGVHRIDVKIDVKGLHKAGVATRLDPAAKEHFKDLGLSPNARYLILLNKDHSLEERYSTLVHELGHLCCGHLGADELAWWEPNAGATHQVAEIEAESVAYLVCRRHDLLATSERYLSAYRTPEDVEMPSFGANAVFQATDYIEKMGQERWKEPKRKRRKENAKAAGKG